MKNSILKLWPELEWIQDSELQGKTAEAWEKALELSVLTADDLNKIPFTLLIPGVKITFMEHKRAVVHIARVCGEQIAKFLGKDLSVNMDYLVSGALLCDIGKLMEYDLNNGTLIQSRYGKLIRHPFSGVSLAERCGIPPEVCHIIAAHANEGDLIKRSVEATIVHHADFMTFLPFKEKLDI